MNASIGTLLPRATSRLPGAFFCAFACALLAGPAVALEPGLVLPDLPTLAPADAATQARAAQIYETTRQAYEARDLEEALRSSRELFSALPNASTALLRAQILETLGRANPAFAALLVAADLDPTPAELGDVEAALARVGPRCQPPLGWVRLAVPAAGGAISVAGRRVDPPRTLGLSAGSFPVEAWAPEHRRSRESIVVRAGSGSRRVYELERLPAPLISAPANEVVVAATTTGSRGPRGVQVLGWSLVGGGLLLAGGGAGLHVWALDARDQGDRLAASPPELAANLTTDDGWAEVDAWSAAHAGAKDDAQTRSAAAYALYGAGAAAALAGVILLLVQDDGPAPILGFAPTHAWGQTGLELWGRF